MRYSFNLVLILVVLLGFQACDQSEDNIPNISREEFPDLKIFLDKFEVEAKLRGYNFDFSNLDLVYVDEIKNPDGSEYWGFGFIKHPVSGKRTIQISKSPGLCDWANKTDIERENLFFHLMGRAFLNLQPDNALMCNGKPLSMMSITFNNFNIYKENEPELREYYIDELFDRLAANEQCIDFRQNFTQNPVFFKNDLSDPLWRFSNDNGRYQVSRGIHPNSFSTTFLVISSTGTGQKTGYIYKELEMPNIPEGATVILRTKVNAENLEGPGVAIAMRVYDTKIGTTGATTNESHTLTTEPNPVNGKLENHVLELRLPNFTRKTIFILPFAVMMPGTKGEAFFDDFEILVEPV
ncbi:hypothetical protein MMU07_06755 [Aquiflexum sp. LQ15W]|uniref:hypothetical protein n=1 Tax=Cognataquiflexum nitidum TaxID=2922272 RepID=UPI001F13BB67|nr:hypothetical protein [Cognataquiflexum nitidum]MCH6199268.1 hypothetical protein [Cognataquiflexum nitidum]